MRKVAPFLPLSLLAILLAGVAVARLLRNERPANRPEASRHSSSVPGDRTETNPTESSADPSHGRSARNRSPRSPASQDQNPAPERPDPFKDAPVISSKRTPQDPEGRFTRVKVLRTTFKYPFIRVVETVVTDPKDGSEEVKHHVEMVADHVLVKLKPGKKEEDLRAVSGKYGARIRKKMYTPSSYLVELAGPGPDAVDRAVEAFNRETETVEFAEPDYILYGGRSPNDPRYNELWGLHNLGQTGGTPDSDIDAPEAWDISTGSSLVRVGVIDTGVDYTHPDLAANIWINPGETPGNGLDDDGNGFIDDVRGWDFANDDNDPMDDNDHGTHVAGSIGAVGNNAAGVTGVCWTVGIVPIKFLGGSGGGATSDAVDSVTYATTLGVDLTNNSWGGYGASQALQNAIAAANSAGILFVAAAGNDGINTDFFPHYPSAYPVSNIISVAATDSRDLLASFSNFGNSSVHLAAPGVSILSTTRAGAYRSMSGTSMASPYVAGVCALLKANTPGLTGAQIRNNVLSSVDRISALSGACSTGGRLNAFEALVTNSGPYVALLTFVIGDDGTLGTSGNGNGQPNPGERVGVLVALVNIGSAPANGVTANISLPASSPWVTLVQTSATYGNIAPQTAAVGNQPYLVDIDPAAPDQTPIGLDLTIQDTSSNQWTGSITLLIFGSSGMSGTVTLDGQPVAGAKIEYRGPIEGIAQTAADGSYQIDGVSGTYTLICKKSGLADSDPVQVTVPPDATGVDFVYTTRTIAGTVTDGDTAAPLQGATVVTGGPLSGSTTTDAAGAYLFSVGIEGSKTFALQATKPDTHSPSSPRNVTLPPDAAGIDFQLFPVRYDITDIGTLGGLSSFGYGMNEKGHVVGMAQVTGGNFRGFLWDGTTITDLGTISSDPSASSQAFAVNELDQVVGTSGIAGNSNAWAFLWDGGTMTQITGSQAHDINESGQVALFDSSNGKAYLWESGTATDLGSLSGGNTSAWALNNAAWVVGSSGPSNAFLWQSGTMTDIGSLIGAATSARDVNNFGQVIGKSGNKAYTWKSGVMSELQTAALSDSEAFAVNDVGQVVGTNDSKAAMWENGVRIDLNDLIPQTLGWNLQEARDINTAGQIAGFGTLGGQTRAFLMTPVKTAPQAPPTITTPPSATPNPVRLPATAALQVGAQDDGLPVPPGSVIYTWSVLSGPGSASFSPNGTPAADATAAAFSAPGVYTVNVSVSDGSAITSDTVVVTVHSADITPPAIVAVAANGSTTQVKVAFDEPVEAASAETDTNYQISGGVVGVTVLNAVLGADGRTVTLTTSPLSSGEVYTLTVGGINDLSFPPNTIPANTQTNFKYNALPVAQDLNTSTPEDTAVAITLQATDADNPTLTYQIVSPPANGSLSGTPPDVTYTPSQDFFGTDTFTYRADDGEVAILAPGNTATVTIDVTPVNDPPVARDLAVTVPVTVGSPITLIATDVENDPLTYAIITPPSNGSLSGTPPNVIYTPNPTYTGPDQFTYEADDGSLPSNTATVSITVLDNTLWAWGHNGSGRLGDGTMTNRNAPVQITAITDVVVVDGATAHTAVVKADGTAWGWGLGTEGQLGNGAKNSSSVPVQVSGLAGVTDISGGHYHTMAVLSNGTVWGWGFNTKGQLGTGSTGGPGFWDNGWDTPQQTQTLTTATAVAAGAEWSMALLSGGTVWAWGSNAYGELGDGTTTERYTPAQVLSLSSITAISAGANHGPAPRND